MLYFYYPLIIESVCPFKLRHLGFSLLFLFYSCLCTSQDTIYLSKYIEKYSDLSLSTYYALEEVKKTKAQVLVIPKGDHHFYAEKAYEQYVRMSNNINGIKRIAFPLVGHSNLQIQGNGAKIILHGIMMGMIIHDSNNISIHDLSFDWERPFYLQGMVESVDPSEHSYILSFDPKENITVTNNDLFVLRPEGKYSIRRSFWFDPDTGAPVYNLEKRMNRFWDPYRPKHYELEAIGNHRIKVINKLDSLPEKGWHFIAKWRNQPNVNRIAPSLHIQQSKQILLDGVNIHSAAGMGIIAEKSENISLSKVHVKPTPNRVISTTADATHFVNCKGLIKVEECLFEASLDDGLNIHGNYTTIREVLDSVTVLAEIVHVQQKGFVFAEKGDSIHIINPNNLLPIDGPFIAKEVVRTNDSYFRIRFDRPIPSVQNGYGLENISWNADLVFRNNIVQKNWARAVLFKTGGKILIEDNYFSSSMSALRNWGEMKFFNESGRVNDVVIRNNTIHNVSRVGNGQPPIVIFPQIKDIESMQDDQFYNRNIVITGNTIHAIEPFILFAQSLDGLEFSDNEIIINSDLFPLYTDRPSIEIKRCRNLLMKGNKFRGTRKYSITLDDFTQTRSHLGRIEHLIFKRKK